MPVLFSGFPRLIERRALRPGRWFLAPSPQGAQLCMATGVGEGPSAVVVMFGLGRLDHLDFRTRPLSGLAGSLQSVEDEFVFTPGEADRPRLLAASPRPFASGSLLRLTNGDMGVGFAESLEGPVHTVSLSTGLPATGVDLVFDRWSLTIRRGGEEALVGRFRGDAVRNGAS